MKQLFLITLISISVFSCTTSLEYVPDNYPFEKNVEVKILSIDTTGLLYHIFYEGRESKTNKIIYLISQKDSTFKYVMNDENVNKIYPFKTYKFEIVKAPPDIAMWKYYPDISGTGIERDDSEYVSIWSNGKFDVDVYTSPNLIDKYYIKK